MWEWLEIEPTKDANVIKAAFAEAAKKYHPAEHPDEFRELRDCYKRAMRYAQGSSERRTVILNSKPKFGEEYKKKALAEMEASRAEQKNKTENEKFQFNLNKQTEESKNVVSEEEQNKLQFDLNNETVKKTVVRDEQEKLKFDLNSNTENTKKDNQEEEQEYLQFDLNSNNDNTKKENQEDKNKFQFDLNNETVKKTVVKDEQEKLKFDLNNNNDNTKKDNQEEQNKLQFDLNNETVKKIVVENEQEKLKFDLNSNSDNTKKENQEEQPRDDLQFNLNSDTDEDQETPNLDFSNISHKQDLSETQTMMLNFVREMFDSVAMKPGQFCEKKTFETILYGWDKAPYKDEITPHFAELFMDILGRLPVIDKGSFETIERVIIGNDKGPEFESLRPRFRAAANISPTGKVILGKNDKANVLLCLKRYTDKPIHEIPFGYIFSEGTFKKWRRCVVYPLKNILLVSYRKRIRYYFIKDLTCRIDAKTDKMTISDYSGNVILKVPSMHPSYQYLLNHLKTHRCHIVSPKHIDLDTYICGLSSFSKLFTGLMDKVRIFAISLVMNFILMILLTLGKSTNFEYFYGLILAGYIILVGWIFILAFLASAGQIIVMLVQLLGILPKVKELKEEVKNGQAGYVIGKGVFLFTNYMIWYDSNCYNIVKISDINDIERDTELDKNNNNYRVTIHRKNGIDKTLWISVISCINAIKSYVNEVSPIANREGLTLEQQCKYDRIRKSKFKFFRLKYMLAKPIAHNYLWHVIIIPCAIFMDCMLWHEVTTGKFKDWDLDGISGYILLAYVGTAMALFAVVGLIRYRKVPVDRLLDMGIQVRHFNPYHNKTLNIYVLKDYFVAYKLLYLKVIPYSEITSITMDAVKGQRVIKIVTRDGKVQTFGGGKTAAAANNDPQVIEVMSNLKLRYLQSTKRSEGLDLNTVLEEGKNDSWH